MSKTYRFSNRPIEVNDKLCVPLILLFSENEFVTIDTDAFSRWGGVHNLISSVSGLPTLSDDTSWGSYAHQVMDKYVGGLKGNLGALGSPTLHMTRVSIQSAVYRGIASIGLCINYGTTLSWAPFIPINTYNSLRQKIYSDKLSLTEEDIKTIFSEAVFLFPKGFTARYLTDLRKVLKEFVDIRPLKQVRYDTEKILDGFSKNPLTSLGLKFFDKKWQVEQFKHFLSTKEEEFKKIEKKASVKEIVDEKYGARDRDDMENFILETFTEAMEEANPQPGSGGISSSAWVSVDNAGVQDGHRPTPGVGIYRQMIDEDTVYESTDINWDQLRGTLDALANSGNTPTVERTTPSSENSETITDESEGITDEEIAEVRAMLEELSNNG